MPFLYSKGDGAAATNLSPVFLPRDDFCGITSCVSILPWKGAKFQLIMGERKIKTSAKPPTAHPAPLRKMTVPSRVASTGATIVRCPTITLSRLRGLNEAEIVTLFTPFVPHPPTTVLAKNMDPFEPLGRALPRPVRHVPYRLDNGMTETHADFLPTSGVIMIVVCSTENVVSYNRQAFEQQARFARNVKKRVEENRSLAENPVVVLLVTNGAASHVHEDELKDFPALVICNNYAPETLEGAARLVFGS